MAKRCVAPGHKTVPRLPILAVPFARNGGPSPSNSIRARKEFPLAAQIYWAIREGDRERAARPRARAIALLARSGRSARRLPAATVARGPMARLIAEQFAIGLGPAGNSCSRAPASVLIDRLVAGGPRLCPELFHEFGKARRWHFRWECPLKMPSRSSCGSRIPYWSDPAGCGGAGGVSRSAWRSRAAKGGRGLLGGWPRGVRCSPSQVLVTGGFSGALGLAIQALQLERMGGLDRGSRLSAHSHRARPGWHGCDSLSRSMRMDWMVCRWCPDCPRSDTGSL